MKRREVDKQQFIDFFSEFFGPGGDPGDTSATRADDWKRRTAEDDKISAEKQAKEAREIARACWDLE